MIPEPRRRLGGYLSFADRLRAERFFAVRSEAIRQRILMRRRLDGYYSIYG